MKCRINILVKNLAIFDRKVTMTLLENQPRSQGLSSSRMRDPGNEVVGERLQQGLEVQDRRIARNTARDSGKYRFVNDVSSVTSDLLGPSAVMHHHMFQ